MRSLWFALGDVGRQSEPDWQVLENRLVPECEARPALPLLAAPCSCSLYDVLWQAFTWNGVQPSDNCRRESCWVILRPIMVMACSLTRMHAGTASPSRSRLCLLQGSLSSNALMALRGHARPQPLTPAPSAGMLNCASCIPP